jgi:hypothetical protein
MTPASKAFAGGALALLPLASLLAQPNLLAVTGAWPAMVQIALFGWITGMIVAINYHTMPVFAARDFPYPRLVWLHLSFWIVGITTGGASQLLGWDPGVAIGLAAQLAAALIFVANTLLLILRGRPRASRPPTPAIAGQPRVDRLGTRATTGAGLALPLALGLLLAARMGWLAGEWVLAAEHLATLGWIMLMIVGVAYHVLPRFSGRGTRGPGWAAAQLACHYAALALIVPALGLGWGGLFALGGLLMALALALFAWTIWPAIDWPIRA